MLCCARRGSGHPVHRNILWWDFLWTEVSSNVFLITESGHILCYEIESIRDELAEIKNQNMRLLEEIKRLQRESKYCGLPSWTVLIFLRATGRFAWTWDCWYCETALGAFSEVPSSWKSVFRKGMLMFLSTESCSKVSSGEGFVHRYGVS